MLRLRMDHGGIIRCATVFLIYTCVDRQRFAALNVVVESPSVLSMMKIVWFSDKYMQIRFSSKAMI